MLDDGSRENDIGIGGTLELLWVNRFTPAAADFPFDLTEFQVYFSTEGLVHVGDTISLVVYENTTGNSNTDPAVGSNFLASFPATVQAVDAWSVYSLSSPVRLNGPGDVIIGVIGLEVPGTSYWPASLDQTASQQRSWFGWWNSSPPPATPTLPPDNTWDLIDNYFPGNLLVRGSGVVTACIDADNDTYGAGCAAGPDCSDNDSSINPGATEVCDGIDNDCDGGTDEGCVSTTTSSISVTTTTVPGSGCVDADNDTYGENCPAGPDCDDADAFYTDICPDCEVKVVPQLLGWLIGDREKTRTLLVIGKRGTEFGDKPVIKWESGDIEVVKTKVMLKRLMLMKVTLNGEPLEKQWYRVLVGTCEGRIRWTR